MLINLWGEHLSTEFMELYHISSTQMCNILERLAVDEGKDNIAIFCDETGLKLDEINVVDNELEFLGKIVSTTIDDCNHLKKNGLIPIDVLLEQHSPIQQHLKSHHIELYPSTHELFYMGKRYFIPSFGQDCDWCAYSENECRYAKSQYKNISCPYLNSISRLGTKLYSDNAEIEMFLVSPREKMLSYSTVSKHPEILYTIEKFIADFFMKSENICLTWKNKKQYSYIISCQVKYEDMSYRGEYVDSHCVSEALNIFSDYEKYCKKNYCDINQIPKCFWDNVWIINTCLSVIGSFGEIHSEIYAGIKHEIEIPFDKLSIEIIQE